MKQPPLFIISTTPRLQGARLSKSGDWGNRPFESIDDAVSEVRRLGGERAVVEIRMEVGR